MLAQFYFLSKCLGKNYWGELVFEWSIINAIYYQLLAMFQIWLSTEYKLIIVRWIQCLLFTPFLSVCCWFERTIIVKIHHDSFESDIAMAYLEPSRRSTMELFCKWFEWVLNILQHRLTRSYHKVTKIMWFEI